MQLGPPVLNLPSPTLYIAGETATVRQAYRSLIGNIADLLADSPSSGRLLDIRDFVDFETNIAKATVAANQSTSSPSILSMIAFVRQYLPSYRLGRELLSLLHKVFSAVQPRVLINESLVISVQNAGFYGLLGEQLASVEREGNDGKRILANYIGWSIVFSQLPLLPLDYQNALQQFSTASGILFKGLESDAWEDCLSLVNSAMPNAVTFLFGSKYLPLSSKAKVVQILSLPTYHNELIVFD